MSELTGSSGRAGGKRVGARGEQAGRRQRARQAQQAWARGGLGLGPRGALRGRTGRAAWERAARGGGVPVRTGWACWLGQLGQVGAQCTWLSSNSVFGTILTQYYS